MRAEGRGGGVGREDWVGVEQKSLNICVFWCVSYVRGTYKILSSMVKAGEIEA